MSTLVEIAPTPTAENSAIHLHPSDNVAIARVTLSAGQTIRVAGRDLTLRRDVPAGHKVAVRPVAKGDNLIRYGQVIGRASTDIQPGDHVHTHNLAFEELRPSSTSSPSGRPLSRRRGRTADVPRLSARRRPRRHAQLHRRGRRQQLRRPHRRTDRRQLRGRDAAAERGRRGGFPARRGLRRTRSAPIPSSSAARSAGVLDHPNVSRAIILGLGCEVNQIEHYLGPERAAQPTGWSGMTLQDSGGTRGHRGSARARRSAGSSSSAAAEKRIGSPSLEDRPRPELRRIGFVLRHHGESGARASARTCWRRSGLQRCSRKPPRSSEPSICS